MITRPPDHERGLVLVNVLLMVALASGIIAAILVAENAGIGRSLRLHEAASADAALDGAELSAIAALRRDMLVRPESDDRTEPWARIADSNRGIAGGSFTLLIADAQAQFNINAAAKDPSSQILLPTIVQALNLPPETTPRIIALLQAAPLTSLAQLRGAGLDAPAIARLATLCTALPADAVRINVNTADAALLGILLGDRIAGQLLVSRRARQGALKPDDFALAHASLPAAAGFTSDHYWIRGRIRIGDTTREQTSLLRREMVSPGQPRVTVIGRWTGMAAPLDAPRLEPAPQP